jgi:hypothetical protein
MAADRELVSEQAHLDQTYAAYDALIDVLSVSRRDRHGDVFTEEVLEQMRLERLRAYTSASGPLYFGRIDGDNGSRLYVGRHAVADAHAELLAINWRAPAAEPFYAATPADPRGVTRRRRLDSGAESTIHGLLSMLALDAHPGVARWARVANVSARDTRRVVEAEGATLSGGAHVVTPPSAWTGESAWSGGAYVDLPAGGEVAFGPVDGFVEVVALRTEGAGGGATGWGSTVLDHSNAGPSGASGAPGRLEVLPLGERHGDLVARQAGDGVTALDAIQVQPLIEHVTLRGGGREQTLLRSFARGTRRVAVAGRASAYDARGRLVSRARGAVVIPSGGFAIAER